MRSSTPIVRFKRVRVPLEDLRVLAPQSLFASESLGSLRAAGATLRRHEVARARLTLQRRDGTTFEAACSVTPIASASGGRPYFVGVVHDLTEEVRLRESAGEAGTAVGNRRGMSGATHEISEPLQSTIGRGSCCSTAARRRGQAAPRSHARRGRSRPARIVRALQWFVRRAPYDRQPIDLNDNGTPRGRLAAQELAATAFACATTCASLIPAVFASGDDVQQVVWQLVMQR
jgi:hypothetical protein